MNPNIVVGAAEKLNFPVSYAVNLGLYIEGSMSTTQQQRNGGYVTRMSGGVGGREAFDSFD